MLKQEGDKPQLTIVPADAQALEPTYGERLVGMIGVLTKQKLKGERIEVAEALSLLDPAEDNSMVRDWLVSNDVTTKAGFDKLLARIASNRKIEDELGFVPKDVIDFVERYAETRKVTLNARGTVSRAKPYQFGDAVIDARNCDTSRETRLIYDVANAEGDNLESYGRELRLVNDRLNLGYRDSSIADAINAWQEGVVRELKVRALQAVAYERGRATGPEGNAMWEAMERACFDVSEVKPGFAIAVLKKFIWQVKRKARGMTVTNHLMPVLTGAQGKGKTQFVKALTLPLHDLMREVDFNLITDGKTTDIWASLILFIDEMGSFTKADVDAVKNVITSTERSIRAMRQNSSQSVRNSATLIGCTNKSLGQLIRDETGGRRFAELMWRNDPDWEASNAVDWALLWQSVDEDAADPMFAADMADVLRQQQEDNRNQSPIEVWAREHAHTLTNWKKASELHLAYREWERDAFPSYSTTQNMFGKTLTNLIKTLPDFPVEKSQKSNGIVYRRKETL